MSKARPHAHVYEKWVRGIRTAVPDEKERCGLYEYIIGYQLAKVYNAGEMPSVNDLSSAAAIALALLEGDLDELCEARREANSRRAENGKSTQAGPSRAEQDLTIQSKAIQNNTTQSNNNTMQALADLAGQKALNEFDLGLALLRKGYIIKAADLHAKYARAAMAKNPVAYAAAGLIEADDKAALTCAANYLERTGCRDTRALELYGAQLAQEDGEGVLNIRCTAAARDAIGKAGQDKARGYLQTIGATAVNFVCNG
ncbi:MAG: hypothetical protein IK073_05705 [Paludibacteraceae bacterium]|nr:hypothetical protein [Paludibacteraceae bacterium]